MRGRLASAAAAAAGLVLIILLFDAPAGDGTTSDRLIVKVKLENEDTTWLQKLEPTWRNEIIDIKSMYSHAHPKAHRPDKGRVANAYLTWIIENYNNLPEIIVFLSPKDSFEHEPLDLRKAIPRIQIPFIQSTGFANLHCPTQKSLTTCNNRVLLPESPPSELRTLEAKMPNVWREWFGQDSEVPERIAAVRGADFVASRDQVRKQRVERYLKIYTWLNKTIMDDDSAGLVCEWMWHVLFGKGTVECPERERCECQLYGNCEG
ncbi:hypothetical protein BKA63DRAFT_528809 [Paraphoma chrysanthemicola]|nr:hypothetical protein BKA63DRAFT_528809 [Paraphoma chrysanthemicola]